MNAVIERDNTTPTPDVSIERTASIGLTWNYVVRRVQGNTMATFH